MRDIILSFFIFLNAASSFANSRNSAVNLIQKECYYATNFVGNVPEDFKLFCSGSLEEIKVALENNTYSSNQELKINNGYITPLLIAAAYGKKDIFFYLLSQGADPSKLGPYKISALHLTSEIGHLEMTKALIEMNLDFYVHENYSGLPAYTRFIYPSFKNKLDVSEKREMLKLFMDAGANINWKNRNGANLLSIIANTIGDSDYELVKDIISYGADLENKPDNEYGNTPLTIAIRTSSYQIFELLLRSGANPNERNILCSLVGKDDSKYSGHLTQENFKELLELIFQSSYNKYKENCVVVNEKDKTPLMQLASKQTFPFAIPYLISKGLDINASIDGMTAYHHLCDMQYPYERTYTMAQALIDNGIDFKSPSRNPLHYCFEKNIRLMHMAVDHGADLELKRNDYTILSRILLSANIRYNPLVIKLIHKGADVNVRSTGIGLFPLFYASKYSAELVAELLKYGADINMQTWSGFSYNGGKTALIEAVQSNAKECVKVLVKAGASLDVQDYSKKRAIDYAKDDEMRSLLQRNI